MPDSHINPATKSSFLLFLLTPLVYPGFFPFDVNLILASSTALLFVSCSLFETRRLYIPKAFTLSFLAVLFLQLSLSASSNLLAPEIWQLQTIAYSVALLMFIAGISIPAVSLPAWMHLYISAAGIWSVIGLFVWLGGTGGLPLEIGSVTSALAPALKLAGPFNQGNIFATAVGFAWLFAHWLYIRTEKPIYAVTLLFFTAMLIDSLSKGGWLAFILALSLLIFAQRVGSTWFIKRLLPLWLIGGMLGLLFLEFSQPRAAADAFMSISQADASMGFRLLIWASAIAELLSSPWTGVGWGQFPAQFWLANPEAQSWLAEHVGWQSSLYSQAMSAHNLLLQVLAEAGAVALLLLIWGIWKFLRSGVALLANGNSPRLPFMLASLAFLLQSQLNISYTQPIPLLMATFFSGIAVAPWLRKQSWKPSLAPAIRGTALAVSFVALIWAVQLTQQWFSTEQAIRDFDIKNEQSIRRLADAGTAPRLGIIPMVWLGYNIAITQEHPGLLTWMLPYLRQSIHEVPFVDSYQVLFYALAYSQNFQEACQLGKIISRRNLPGEKNDSAYREVCEGKTISHYEFGH